MLGPSARPKSDAESRDLDGTVRWLKRQVEVLQSLVLTHRDSISEVMDKLAMSSEKRSGGHGARAQSSLAESARLHRRTEKTSLAAPCSGCNSLRQLVENVLCEQAAVHVRLRQIESTSMDTEVGDLRKLQQSQAELAAKVLLLQEGLAQLSTGLTPKRLEDASDVDSKLEPEIGRAHV
eukprot:TRINITY_DN44969_c0_g1_i1.p2 TRINITY_DN44969_c0_g1~~TRINITY_DN44969_c0_g1_i1.p2  ORF type:complete len:179 (+),score=43.05 TRINITY_DN44969_c0_g1_i1:64-600(+)